MKTTFKKVLSKMIGELEEMREKIETFKGEAEDINSDLQGAFDDKSEKWQEGDAG